MRKIIVLAFILSSTIAQAGSRDWYLDADGATGRVWREDNRIGVEAYYVADSEQTKVLKVCAEDSKCHIEGMVRHCAKVPGTCMEMYDITLVTKE